MEVLSQFGRGENPLRDLAACGPCNQTIPDNLDSPGVSSSSPAPISPLLSPVVSLPHHPMTAVPVPADTQQGSHTLSLMYLMDCYARVTVEERNHPKVRTWQLHDRVPCLLKKFLDCHCVLWLQSW